RRVRPSFSTRIDQPTVYACSSSPPKYSTATSIQCCRQQFPQLQARCGFSQKTDSKLRRAERFKGPVTQKEDSIFSK
ncbi:hypothetical protein JG687_00000749, partial [Phytophthora cactorum]